MRRTPEERRAFVETRAEQMKAAPTPAETAMWEILEPLGFARQVTITGTTKNGGLWSYILDFAQYEMVSGERVLGKLAVEVDGGIHKRQRGRDRRRDTRLRGEGIRTIRVKNKDVLKWPETIRETIEGVLRANGGGG